MSKTLQLILYIFSIASALINLYLILTFGFTDILTVFLGRLYVLVLAVPYSLVGYRNKSFLHRDAPVDSASRNYFVCGVLPVIGGLIMTFGYIREVRKQKKLSR